MLRYYSLVCGHKSEQLAASILKVKMVLTNGNSQFFQNNSIHLQDTVSQPLRRESNIHHDFTTFKTSNLMCNSL